MSKTTFSVVSLMREDFESIGFDGSQLTDLQMERIATKIGEVLVENQFWIALEHWAGEMELKTIDNGQQP